MNRISRLILRSRGLVVLVGTMIVAFAATFSSIDRVADPALRSLRAELRETAPSGSIVLVELDARSLEEVGRWPWPRRLHGEIVERLNRAGARRIAFDIDFSTSSTPANDQAFAAAISQSHAEVVLGAMAARAYTGAGGGASEVFASKPNPLFAPAKVAGLMVPSDDDGVVRRGFAAFGVGDAVYPSMSTVLAGATAPRHEADIMLDQAIDLDRLPTLGAVDVIEGRFDPALVRGKTVIVGPTAVVLGDRVPLFGEYLPGVLVHILGAETLLSGKALRDEGALPMMALALLSTLAVAFVRSRRIVTAAVVATLLLLIAGPLLLEDMFGILVNVVAAMITLAAALAIRLLVSLARSYFTGVSTNDLSGLPNAHALHLDAIGTGLHHVAVARVGNFGAITAVLGEEATGELLRRIAERIALGTAGAAIYHTSDAEFLWLVPPGSEQDVPDRFDALHALLSAPIRVAQRPIDVAMTFGLCTTEPDLQGAMRGASLAAELAQARGLRWNTHSSDEQDEVNWRMGLLGELDSAIDAGQLWVAYQPKYDLTRRRVTGAEALVRWQHPERGAIPPDHFVPIAEESGRIAKLTRFVIETALADLASLGKGAERPVVSVNLSTTLLTAPGIVEQVCDTLWRHGVLPEQLILEITESAAMTGDEVALGVLTRFRSMGIGISIDDYGTGQSSLAYLKTLPATELKIDQSFVRAIADSRSDEILVNSTIQLGHQLGLKVVAEGVETAQVMGRLEAFGCDVIQGYLVGKPTPFAEFARIWKQARALVAA